MDGSLRVRPQFKRIDPLTHRMRRRLVRLGARVARVVVQDAQTFFRFPHVLAYLLHIVLELLHAHLIDRGVGGGGDGGLVDGALRLESVLGFNLVLRLAASVVAVMVRTRVPVDRLGQGHRPDRRADCVLLLAVHPTATTGVLPVVRYLRQQRLAVD